MEWFTLKFKTLILKSHPVPFQNSSSYIYFPGYILKRHGAQRSELSDYKGSKKNYNAIKESCLLSNIVPQNPSCNRGIWRIIESKAREMAVKYGEVWIITGPVFEKQQKKKIGSGVCVPDDV